MTNLTGPTKPGLQSWTQSRWQETLLQGRIDVNRTVDFTAYRRNGYEDYEVA